MGGQNFNTPSLCTILPASPFPHILSNESLLLIYKKYLPNIYVIQFHHDQIHQVQKELHNTVYHSTVCRHAIRIITISYYISHFIQCHFCHAMLWTKYCVTWWHIKMKGLWMNIWIEFSYKKINFLTLELLIKNKEWIAKTREIHFSVLTL